MKPVPKLNCSFANMSSTFRKRLFSLLCFIGAVVSFGYLKYCFYIRAYSRSIRLPTQRFTTLAAFNGHRRNVQISSKRDMSENVILPGHLETFRFPDDGLFGATTKPFSGEQVQICFDPYKVVPITKVSKPHGRGFILYQRFGRLAVFKFFVCHFLKNAPRIACSVPPPVL